jgi:hypothetical protein
MSDSNETKETGTVPPFIQIITAMSNAFGRTDAQVAIGDSLYGLDAQGRVWEWNYADPDRKGSRDGWAVMENDVYLDGEDPPVEKKTR